MDKDKGDDEKRYCCGCDILSISTTVVILTLIITLFVTLSAALVVKEDSKMFFKNGTFAGKEVKTLKKPLTGVVATYAIWSVSSFVGYIGCAQMNWILLGQFFVVSILCKVFTLLGIVVVLGNGHFTIFFEFELTGGLMVFGFFILIGEALGQVIVFRTTRYMFGLAKEDSLRLHGNRSPFSRSVTGQEVVEVKSKTLSVIPEVSHPAFGQQSGYVSPLRRTSETPSTGGPPVPSNSGRKSGSMTLPDEVATGPLL